MKGRGEERCCMWGGLRGNERARGQCNGQDDPSHTAGPGLRLPKEHVVVAPLVDGGSLDSPLRLLSPLSTPTPPSSPHISQ